MLFDDEKPKRKAMGAHEMHGAGENIWLTPRYIIDALGPFDLDPCYSPPRPWPTAAEHYGPDAADGLGGLFAPWRGFVWCNPPYGDRWREWLAKCAEHDRAIALIFARTETADFHAEVWAKATALLFLKGRITFHNPDGSPGKGNAGAPSVLIAYGDEAAERLKNCSIPGHYVALRERRAAA